MVGLIFSALAQLNAMLSQTYHVMGAAAAAGFAIDVAVCVIGLQCSDRAPTRRANALLGEEFGCSD